ncbi:hypothetical protein BJX62DRAFT_225030 [Aspergillus germanicus]
MNSYNPAKYALRAPPPIPPRPGAAAPIPSPRMTSHYAPSPAPPQHSFPSSQQSIPPEPSAYQSPPYYASAPPTAQIPTSPQVPSYGPPTASPQYVTHQSPGISPLPPYQPPATPAYPPPPTNPPPYTSSPRASNEDPATAERSQAPDEPHVTAERYAIGTFMKSHPPQTSSPYQPEPGAGAPPPPPGPPPLSASVSGIEILTESMSHARIGPGAEAPKDQQPPIQYNAPAKFTLRQCPSTEYTFSGESQWYIHPQVSDFRICVYCYEKHIQSGTFEGEFHSWTSPAGSCPQCLFSCPRIEDDIWPRAVHSGNLRELLDFFARRLSIPNCPRQRGVPATENVKWYQPRDKRKFPDFLACQACYEDVLLSGALRDEFILFTGTQAKETLFICDAANLFVRKLATKTNSMDIFIPEIIRHLRLPECEKNGKLTDGPSSSITICERCFEEYAAHTDFETYFQPTARPNAQHRCMLGLWQSRSVWDEALALHNFLLWERTMLEVNNTPLCTLEIAHDVPVYQIPGVENFDLNLTSGRTWYGNDSCWICPACYEEVVRDSYLAKQGYFPPTPVTLTEETVCDLYSPRMRSKFKTACTAQDATAFLTFATHRKNIYTQTVPEMRALVARSKHNLSMQKMYNTTSSAYNNMDGMGMYDTGIRYTGSGVAGVFRTHWGVEGAAMGQTALGYMQQIQVDAARVRYLQGVWDGVE